jgi:rare lipoprotein A
LPRVDLIPEPDVVDEPRSRYGNRSPYTVLGKSYQVRESTEGFVEQGLASFYGNKFHGRRTSNLEVYDMYAFTAAHKTLPLPSFARVTNLENGRSVIVRVNDRGPFHEGRVVDLSWAAAVKLDMHRAGTARVEVRALAPAAGSYAALQAAPAAARPARSTRWWRSCRASRRPSPMAACRLRCDPDRFRACRLPGSPAANTAST